MRPANDDRLRVLLTCDPSHFAATQAFYCETLGFEPEYTREEAGERLVGMRLDGTRVILATPKAFGVGAPVMTVGATVILMHPDVEAHQRAVSVRYTGEIGEVRAMGAGTFYELRDPSGHRVWIMQVD